MKATVYRSTGSWYEIKDDAGRMWKARIKGIFKIDGITSTNPIAVGDEVIFEEESSGERTAMITGIEPRYNYISRQSPSHRKQHHIVASNLNQVLLVATFKTPRTSTGFVDRFVIAADAYHVPATIVINKMDTWKTPEYEQLAQWQSIYEPLGISVLSVSAQTGEGMEVLEAVLHEKRTLISGHSGVGKSSLLNGLMPGRLLKTQAVSTWSGKGTHATTFAEMLDLAHGGQVIDTPGLREFGIVDIPKEELSHYFKEMRGLLNHCQFNNCLHVYEPGCAIKEAVRTGHIHSSRYLSYLGILDSLPENNWE